MRLIIFFVIFALTNCVYCKNNVKSLTESMGQEVIEIGAPIKDLPADLEEEPSAENEEEITTATQVVTKTTPKKTTTTTVLLESSKKVKDIDRIDGLVEEDEEDRIEKELAEIYKDNNIDYKADSAETIKEVTTNITEDIAKPIARNQNKPSNFKFQPNLNDKKEVERFRTSVDEISCSKRLNIKPTPVPDSGDQIKMNLLSLIPITLMSCFL